MASDSEEDWDADFDEPTKLALPAAKPTMVLSGLAPNPDNVEDWGDDFDFDEPSPSPSKPAATDEIDAPKLKVSLMKLDLSAKASISPEKDDSEKLLAALLQTLTKLKDLQPPANVAPRMVRRVSVGSGVNTPNRDELAETWREDVSKLENRIAHLSEAQERDVIALVKAHSDMGTVFRDHDAMFDAMEQFELGMTLLDESEVAPDDPLASPRKQARAHLQYELGLTAKALQDILQAIENFINALRDIDSEKYRDVWVKIHFELGYCFAKTEQPKKAMDFCNTFLRESISIPHSSSKFVFENWELILQSLLLVGECALKLGHVSLGRKYLKRTIELCGTKFREIEEKAQQLMSGTIGTPLALPISLSSTNLLRDGSSLSARSASDSEREKPLRPSDKHSEDESASSDWDDLLTEDVPQPKFSLVLAENNFGVDADNPKAELGRFRILQEQKSFIAVKYPKPTVLYSIRTTEGHTLLNETELETWLQSLIMKHKDTAVHVKTQDQKDPLAHAKAKLAADLSKLTPYSNEWLALHLSFLHKLYLSAEYSAECWAQLRTFFADMRQFVSKEFKPDHIFHPDHHIINMSVHVIHLACKMWRLDKQDEFEALMQALGSLGVLMDRLVTITRAETASHFRITAWKPSQELCNAYHDLRKRLDAAAPESDEAALCVYLCIRALSNLQLHLGERSALTGSPPKDSEDSMLISEDLPRYDPLFNEAHRMNELASMYARLPGLSFVKAKAAFALGLSKMEFDEDFDTAERLFFEAAYMLDVLEPPAVGVRPIISELGNNIIVCFGKMLFANYKYKYAVYAFDAALLLFNIRGRREEYFALMRSVARIAKEQNDYIRAVDLYTEIVENYREKKCINEAIYVYDILCGLFLELGQFKQAIKSLTMASELLPDHKKFFCDTEQGSSAVPGSATPTSPAGMMGPSAVPGGLFGLKLINFDPLFLKLQLRIARAHLSSYNYDAGVELLERLLRCKVSHVYLIAVIETLSRAYIKKRWFHEAGQALQTLRDLTSSPPTATSSTSRPGSGTTSLHSSLGSSLSSANSSPANSMLLEFAVSSSQGIHSASAVEALATYWELSARNYLHHRHNLEALYCIDRAIHLSVSSRYSSAGRHFYLRGRVLHELFRNANSLPLPFTGPPSPSVASTMGAGSAGNSPSAESVLSNGPKKSLYNFPSWQGGIGIGDEAISIPPFQTPGDLLQECNATYRTAYNFFRNTGDDPRICKTVSAIAELFLQHLFWPVTTKETTFDDMCSMPSFEVSQTATDSIRERSAFAHSRPNADVPHLNLDGSAATPSWGSGGRVQSERARRPDVSSGKSEKDNAKDGSGIFKAKSHQRTQSEVSSPRSRDIVKEPSSTPVPIPVGNMSSSRRQRGGDPPTPHSVSASMKESSSAIPRGPPSPLLDSSEESGPLGDVSHGRSPRRSPRRASVEPERRSKSRDPGGKSSDRSKSRDPPSATLGRKGDIPVTPDRSPLRMRHSPELTASESSDRDGYPNSEKSTPTKDDTGNSRTDIGGLFTISSKTIWNAIEVALEVSLRSCNLPMVLHSYLNLAELRFLEGKKETAQAFLLECKEWIFSVFFTDHVQPILKDAPPGFLEKLWRLTQRASRLLLVFEKAFVNKNLELVDAMICLENILEQVRRRPIGDPSSGTRYLGTEGSLPAQLYALLRPKSGSLTRPKSGIIPGSHDSSGSESSSVASSPLSVSTGDIPATRSSGSSGHNTPVSPHPAVAALAKEEAAIREMAFNLWGYLSYLRQQELRNVEGKISHSELHERCEKVIRKMLRIAQAARSSEPDQIAQVNEKSDLHTRLARRASRRLTLMTPLKKGDYLLGAPRDRSDSSLNLSNNISPASGASGVTPLRSPRKSPSYEDVAAVDKTATLSKVVYMLQMEDRVIHYVPITGAKRMQRFGRKAEFSRGTTAAQTSSSSKTAARSKIDMVYVMIELLDKSHENLTIGVPGELHLSSVLEFLCDRSNWEFDDPKQTDQQQGTPQAQQAQTKRKTGLSFFGSLIGGSAKEERVIKKVHRSGNFFKELRKLLYLAVDRKRSKRDLNSDSVESPRHPPGTQSPKKGSASAGSGVNASATKVEGLVSSALTMTARSVSKSDLNPTAAAAIVSLAARRGQASRYQTASIYPLRSKMYTSVSECFSESDYRDNSPEKPIKLFVYLSASASRGKRGGLSSSVAETLLFSEKVMNYLRSLVNPDPYEKEESTTDGVSTVDTVISELQHAFSPLLEILPDHEEPVLPTTPAASREKEKEKEASELWSRLMDNPTREVISQKPLRLICSRFMHGFPWELILPVGEPIVRCPNLDQLLHMPQDKPKPLDFEKSAAVSSSSSKKTKRTDSAGTLRGGDKSRASSTGSSSGGGTGTFSFISCYYSQGQRIVQPVEQARKDRLVDLLNLNLNISTKIPDSSPDHAAFFPFHCPLVRVARKLSHYKSKYKGVTFVDLIDHLLDPLGPLAVANTVPNPVFLFCYSDLVELSDLVLAATQWSTPMVSGDPVSAEMALANSQLSTSHSTMIFVPESRMKAIVAKLSKLLSTFHKTYGSSAASRYQQLMVALSVVQRELTVPIVCLYPPQAPGSS